MNIMDHLSLIKKKAKESIHGIMVMSMRGLSKMIREMGLVK